MSSNDNRIVRVRQDKIHSVCQYVSNLCDSPYQHVFEELSEMWADGYVFGSETHLVLIEKVLKRKQGS